jgi:predicted dithiol-disulfide oxidoreductase (DUF899 family)
MHAFRFPGESDGYRRARNELLEAEMELRRQLERVAEQRRTLPAGGSVATDYAFVGPCPSCTSIVEAIDGAVLHGARRPGAAA